MYTGVLSSYPYYTKDPSRLIETEYKANYTSSFDGSQTNGVMTLTASASPTVTAYNLSGRIVARTVTES